jgi:ubiquitin-like modifier-activating enzyme ATG7
VSSEGYQLQIPLPSRSLVNSTAEESYLKSVTELEKLIIDHDVIFLLTDSRESRWFPTVLAKFHNKIVITAAIGFDSFLVVRHGQNSLGKDQIGCYFCNDVVSPVDTSTNRTLDQQCTISRPGISSICGGFASEIAISLLQEYNSIGEFIPQCIRGNLTDYNFLCIQQPAFKKYNFINILFSCVACSEYVQTEFKNNKNEFLIKVMNDPYYIENICGVEKLMQEINLDQVEVGDDF